MRMFLIFIALVLSGCAVKPYVYDMSTSRIYEPIANKQNLPNILITDFKYEPSINISQHTISKSGCLFCQSDGSTPGFVYSDPVNKIIQAEVKAAFKEVVIPTSKSSCTLSAIIHLAGFNIFSGPTVDLTYMLSDSDQIKFIKRIRSIDDIVFGFHKVNRMVTRASRKSVEELISNEEFLNVVSAICSENIVK